MIGSLRSSAARLRGLTRTLPSPIEGEGSTASSGQPNVAKGQRAEENQVSSTSGSRTKKTLSSLKSS